MCTQLLEKLSTFICSPLNRINVDIMQLKSNLIDLTNLLFTRISLFTSGREPICHERDGFLLVPDVLSPIIISDDHMHEMMFAEPT